MAILFRMDKQQQEGDIKDLSFPPLEPSTDGPVKMTSVNPNPRANENVDESAVTTQGGVGSEITDGEAG